MRGGRLCSPPGLGTNGTHRRRTLRATAFRRLREELQELRGPHPVPSAPQIQKEFGKFDYEPNEEWYQCCIYQISFDGDVIDESMPISAPTLRTNKAVEVEAEHSISADDIDVIPQKSNSTLPFLSSQDAKEVSQVSFQHYLAINELTVPKYGEGMDRVYDTVCHGLSKYTSRRH